MSLIAAIAITLLVPAARVGPPVQIGPPVDTTPTTTLELSGRCAQWETTALEVGWTLEQWPTVDRVMWCESNCQPGARNRSGAAGLMQVMPGWWAGRDPYDPAANLAIARDVLAAQGWRAWSCR